MAKNVKTIERHKHNGLLFMENDFNPENFSEDDLYEISRMVKESTPESYLRGMNTSRKRADQDDEDPREFWLGN
jgi:hypothetical protein